MIDLADLRSRPDVYQDVCAKKNIRFHIAGFLLLDAKRRELTQKAEELRSRKNSVSKEIPTMDKKAKENALKDMKALSDEQKILEAQLGEVEAQWSHDQLSLPSIPLPTVPVGKDDSENVEVRRWSKPRTFDFIAKDHVQLAEAHGLFDTERGVKISGSRSYFLQGVGAQLHRAVLQLACDHLTKKGWLLFVPPYLAGWEFLMGTGFFPGAEEQTYAVGAESERGKGVESDDTYLIGTAEVSVASYYAGEVLGNEQLPWRACGISPCFRREAGTYGKDTKGLYRVHQFEKVEQVVLCRADQAEALQLFEEIRTNAEELLQLLELPYRVIDVCTGDMGKGKVYMQDIETWMPSRNAYGETHSCSYLGDFQARRLNIKYIDSNGERKFVHTLNNTCAASPRILIPIIENYQNADGSITIPKALQPYMMGLSVIG